MGSVFKKKKEFQVVSYQIQKILFFFLFPITKYVLNSTVLFCLLTSLLRHLTGFEKHLYQFKQRYGFRLYPVIFTKTIPQLENVKRRRVSCLSLNLLNFSTYFNAVFNNRYSYSGGRFGMCYTCILKERKSESVKDASK